MTAARRARRKRVSHDARRNGGRDTRERLITAAREVLERGGYTTASVLTIARRARVSAGALYRHFPSKGDLFVEVLREAADGELSEMSAAALREGTFVGRLDAVVATYARRALHNRRLAWALLHEPVDPLVEAERLVYRRSYCRSMAALLRQGIAAGEFPEQRAELTAAALVGAISETLVGPLSPIGDDGRSEAEVVASLLRFCRRSLGVRDAPALRQVRPRSG